jgi:pimeloyl-ACP methyl ester carboxylesterase
MKACIACSFFLVLFQTVSGQNIVRTNQASGEVLTVKSKDGTRIGFECAGRGPTLLFVHGGVGDRTRWTPMFPLLSSKFTVCAMDRRGRGASGDSPAYSLKKEAEDVAAVVDSRKGEVFVFGHSYGGVAALEAAFLTKHISKLMLYEPPLHEPVGPNLAAADQIDQLVRNGSPEQALILFQRSIVQQPAEEIEKMKARSNWPNLVATIAMQPRQMRALAAYKFDADRMRKIKIPTLLLLGTDTRSFYLKQSIEALQQSLPNSKLVELEGQGHNAVDGGRQALADAILAFTAMDTTTKK